MFTIRSVSNGSFNIPVIENLITNRSHVYREVPPRVEYRLKESGKQMVPAIKLFSDLAEEQMSRLNIGSIKETELSILAKMAQEGKHKEEVLQDITK